MSSRWAFVNFSFLSALELEGRILWFDRALELWFVADLFIMLVLLENVLEFIAVVIKVYLLTPFRFFFRSFLNFVGTSLWCSWHDLVIGLLSL